MSQLADSLAAIVESLRAQGISASLDARNVNPPGVWVTLADVTAPTLGGTFQVRAAVCLIAGDGGSSQSIAALSDLLEKVADVVTFDEPVVPATITPPGVGPLPALVITTSTP